ncbi:MAG: ParB/RepB/Spo0J family partition protein [Treponema sp.]|jgi:ParB family chromosome partitioning protein|nr:ParB/RepB/Spo0J family partition protein [Treponema sp.]
MLVPIEDIKVKKRLRKDSGDIAALAESMKRFGQISPILINRKNVLIAGGRRLEAARSLGWRTINAIEVDVTDELTKLEYELEENVQRHDFNDEETAEAIKKIQRLKNPNILRRIINAIVRFFKRIFGIGGDST